MPEVPHRVPFRPHRPRMAPHAEAVDAFTAVLGVLARLQQDFTEFGAFGL